MRLQSFKVTPANGPRPAGLPDQCFYCLEPLGSEHAATCVLRQRSVVIRLSVEYVIAVPEDWTPEQIAFHRNGSSWCASNVLQELDEQFGGDGMQCMCAAAAIAYVGEADEAATLEAGIELEPKVPV